MFASTSLYEGLCIYFSKTKYLYICLFFKAFHLHWQEPILQLLETLAVDGRARELALSALKPVQNFEECLAVNSSDLGSEELRRTIECTSQGDDVSFIEYILLSVDFLFGWSFLSDLWLDSVF